MDRLPYSNTNKPEYPIHTDPRGTRAPPPLRSTGIPRHSHLHTRILFRPRWDRLTGGYVLHRSTWRWVRLCQFRSVFILLSVRPPLTVDPVSRSRPIVPTPNIGIARARRHRRHGGAAPRATRLARLCTRPVLLCTIACKSRSRRRVYARHRGARENLGRG